MPYAARYVLTAQCAYSFAHCVGCAAVTKRRPQRRRMYRVGRPRGEGRRLALGLCGHRTIHCEGQTRGDRVFIKNSRHFTLSDVLA